MALAITNLICFCEFSFLIFHMSDSTVFVFLGLIYFTLGSGGTCLWMALCGNCLLGVGALLPLECCQPPLILPNFPI